MPRPSDDSPPRRVQARSLERIVNLAQNPPQYPVNPTEEKLPPLVLYITRVFGTRDVVLTTVNPEDCLPESLVFQSLYYIHLDLPSYDHLGPPPEPERASENSAPHAPPSPVRRKPVPPSAKLPCPDPAHDLAPPPAADAAFANVGAYMNLSDRTGPNGDVPVRKPVLPARPPELGAQSGQPPPVPSHTTAPPRSPVQVARKPIGPRPLDTPPRVPDKDPRRSLYAWNAAATEAAIPPRAAPAELPLPPAPPSAGLADLSLSERQLNVPPPFAEHHHPRPLSPTKRSREPSAPFTLSVIGRQPFTTDVQWNVAKVLSVPLAPGLNGAADHQHHPPPTTPTLLHAELPGMAAPSPPASPRHSTGGGASVAAPDLDIRIYTRGYAKFRGFPSRESIDVRRGRAGSAASSLLPPPTRGSNDSAAVAAATTTDEAAGGDVKLARQMVMTYYKSWSSNIRHKLRSRNSSTASATNGVVEEQPLPSPNGAAIAGGLEVPPRPPFHARGDSVGSAGSADSGGSVYDSSSPTKTSFFPKQLYQQHQLQQQLQQLQTQAHLITTPGPGLKQRGYVFTSPWDGLCEFRTGASGRGVKCLHTMGGGSSETTSTVSELRFNLPDVFSRSGHHRRGSSLDIAADADGAMSPSFTDQFLGLGKERAGGGSNGKHGKLGKLIVYDEGQKMLDLVVAANMGLWWGAWERRF